MPLKLYQQAILTVDLPDDGLSAGDVGTVVDEVPAPPGMLEPGYNVEFFDMIGNTVAVVTVRASQLREPTPTDRPSVRVLSTAD
jgi:hypothetical protein